MPTNQILPFGLGSGADVYSYSDWLALSSRTSGVVNGKADAAAANTAWRQAAYMAYVLAQFISDNASVDVLDDGNGATVEANLKKAIQLLGQKGAASYAVDSSSAANALVVTLSPAPTALTDGMVLWVRPANSNTGATTINVNGLGAVGIYSASGAPLVGGEIIQNWPFALIYNALGSVFVLAAPAFSASNSFRNMAVLTSSATWTVPAGVTRIRLRGVGGGGGSAAFIGGNADMPGCGGGAGYFEGIYTVVPGTAYTVTIGAAGAGGTTGNGSAGGTTSFGSLATALGGGGGVNGANPAGGTGGTASGGQINVQGGDGTDGLYIGGYTSSTNITGGPGCGGSTPLGNGARSGVSNAIPGRGYGGGAGAPYNAGATTVGGAIGAPGVVIIEY